MSAILVQCCCRSFTAAQNGNIDNGNKGDSDGSMSKHAGGDDNGHGNAVGGHGVTGIGNRNTGGRDRNGFGKYSLL